MLHVANSLYAKGLKVNVSFSNLEIIFCVFTPFKGVLKRVAENYFVKVLIQFIWVTINHD